MGVQPLFVQIRAMRLRFETIATPVTNIHDDGIPGEADFGRENKLTEHIDKLFDTRPEQLPPGIPASSN